MKEGETMNKMSFVKGMGIGAAVGAAVGMMAAPKKGKSPMISKALKSMGDVVDSVAGTLGR
mgnify:CR=1 FL=1